MRRLPVGVANGAMDTATWMDTLIEKLAGNHGQPVVYGPRLGPSPGILSKDHAIPHGLVTTGIPFHAMPVAGHVPSS